MIEPCSTEPQDPESFRGALPSGRQLLRMAQGLSCLFWGLPLSLLFFSGALKLLPHLLFRIPSFAIPALLMLYGGMHLRAADYRHPRWHKAARALLPPLLAQVYFVPFIYWWEQAPFASYYAAHMLALLAAVIWLLWAACRLTAAWAAVLGDVAFEVESHLSAWVAVAVLSVPFLILSVYQLRLSLRPEIRLPTDWILMLPELPRWILAFSLVPFTLTMGLLWKAKRHCLQILANSRATPDARPPADRAAAARPAAPRATGG